MQRITGRLYMAVTQQPNKIWETNHFIASDGLSSNIQTMRFHSEFLIAKHVSTLNLLLIGALGENDFSYFR